MRVFGYMRFSYVGRSDARATKTGQPIEEVASTLFQPSRMKRRFFLFERLCLPSIRAQTNKDFRLIIVASKMMPDIYKDRIADVTASIPQIEILYGEGEPLSHVINPRMEELVAGIEGPTAHFRLDDDDAIGAGMTTRLVAATALAPLTRIVTYPSGLYLSYRNDEPHLLPEYTPNCAQGLAVLNMPGQITNPYHFAHLQCSQSHPTFSDPVPMSYIHTAHANSDSLDRQSKRFAQILARRYDRDAPGNIRRMKRALRKEFPDFSIESLKEIIKEASTI